MPLHPKHPQSQPLAKRLTRRDRKEFQMAPPSQQRSLMRLLHQPSPSHRQH